MIDTLSHEGHPGRESKTAPPEHARGICHVTWPQLRPEEAVDKTTCITSGQLNEINACVTNDNEDCINKYSQHGKKSQDIAAVAGG